METCLLQEPFKNPSKFRKSKEAKIRIARLKCGRDHKLEESN